MTNETDYRWCEDQGNGTCYGTCGRDPRKFWAEWNVTPWELLPRRRVAPFWRLRLRWLGARATFAQRRELRAMGIGTGWRHMVPFYVVERRRVCANHYLAQMHDLECYVDPVTRLWFYGGCQVTHGDHLIVGLNAIEEDSVDG